MDVDGVTTHLPSVYLRFRFFFAYDYTDALYSKTQVRTSINGAFSGHAHVHWVICNYSGKPAWAQNDAANAAFKAGADYIYRTNDDTVFPVQKNWTSVFIADLRNRIPTPNMGVVGPSCPQGNTAILTHDFTHKSHILIHGFHYPRSLPTWWSDDWITRVYEGHNITPSLMIKRSDITVEHIAAVQRYVVDKPANIHELIQSEVERGRQAVKQYAKRTFGVLI